MNGNMFGSLNETISPEKRLDFVVNSSDSNDSSHNYSNFASSTFESFSGNVEAGENFNTMQMVRPIPIQNGQQPNLVNSKMKTIADLHNFPSSDEDIHHALPVYLPSDGSGGAEDKDLKDGPPVVPARPPKSPYFPPIVNQFPGRSIKPMRKNLPASLFGFSD